MRGLVIFKLDLPKKLKIYLIFYISLLEKVPKNIRVVILEVEKDKTKYKVEKIIVYSEERS
jgi:hypothetical protein